MLSTEMATNAEVNFVRRLVEMDWLLAGPLTMSIIITLVMSECILPGLTLFTLNQSQGLME